MATGFSTRSGPDGYRLNFDTDNLDYYLLMQKIARHCIDGKPAADVVEVRHAKWKYFHKQNKAVCTNCSFERDLDADFGRAIACPNCGARMDSDFYDSRRFLFLRSAKGG